MEQPHSAPSSDSALWPQLEMLGLKTPRAPLMLRHPRLVIGSGDGVQIRLNSPHISPRHAAILSSPAGCFLRDLDSASGTFLNDKRVQEAQVNDQDQIRIGPFVFRYTAASAIASPPPRQTMAPRQSVAPEAPPSPLPAAPALTPPRVSQVPAKVPPVPDKPHDKDAAGQKLLTGHSAALALPGQTSLAPLPNTNAVRLRPVVGRRHRLTAGNRLNEPAPITETDDSAADADDAHFPEGEEDQLQPQTPRGRVAGYLALMLISMGVAAILAWRFSPPIYLIRAAVTFQNQAGESLTRNKTFFEEQESLFQSEAVREAAFKRVSHPKKGDAAIDPGFLAQPGGLRTMGGLKWESPADRPAAASLVLTIRSSSPQGDAARATALILAFCDAQAAPAKSSSATLKAQLLQSEVDGLKQEIAFRNHNPDQIRREIEALKNAAPSELQIQLMQKRQASLREALENAMEERLAAQREARLADKAAHGPMTRPTARSATLPTTLPAGSALRQPSEQVPSFAAETDENAAAIERIKNARSREAQLQGELQQAIRESVEAQVRSERIIEQQQKLQNMQSQLPRLQATLKQKTAELAELKKGTAGIQALPPDDARIVGVKDARGLRVAIAVAGVALLFGLLMIAAARAGPDREKRIARPLENDVALR